MASTWAHTHRTQLKSRSRSRIDPRCSCSSETGTSFRIPRGSTRPPSGKDARLLDVPSSITNRTFGVTVQVLGGLLDAGPAQLRVVLLDDGEVVGQAGMAVGGELDRATGILSVAAGDKASVGLMLTRDTSATVRIVVLDPASDAILAESASIPVNLVI